MKVAVLGGGISGLSAAYYLHTLHKTVDILLFEASSRLGGWIKSHVFEDGTVYEQGPRTLRVAGNSGANTLLLAEELGLQEKVQYVSYRHPSSQNRMIKVRGSLHTLPIGVGSVLSRHEPFSKSLLSMILRDVFVKSVTNTDESLYSFFNRRFGSEIADYIIDPLARGIYAGNSRELSVMSIAKRFHDVEQKYGSVVLGLLRDRKNSEKLDPLLLQSELVKKSKSENWSVWSLMGGLETLPTALAKYLEKVGVNIFLNSPVNSIKRSKKQFVLQHSGEETIVDKVVSCIPATKLKPVLCSVDPDLSRLLSRIPYATVVVVNLEYSDDIIVKQGFGYLVPSSESECILGVIFDTCTFKQGGRTILTVMISGSWFVKNFNQLSHPEDIVHIAREEVLNSLGISQSPVRYNAAVLEHCIPQYVVGHYEVVQNARKLIRDNNLPLYLAGSSYDGVGINDSIFSSKNVIINL